MELHPVDRQLPVAEAHDRPVFKLGVNLKAVGQAVTLDNQRVIARGRKRRGQPGKDTGSAVMHRAQLAMHDVICPHDLAAKGLSDCLMSEADPHQGRACFGRCHCEGQTDPGLIGIAGTGREQDAAWSQAHRLLDIDGIVAVYHHLRPEASQIVNEVVGETVVVIDQQQHGRILCSKGRRRPLYSGAYMLRLARQRQGRGKQGARIKQSDPAHAKHGLGSSGGDSDMARGFLSGVIWGGTVSVLGAGLLSVLAEAPAPPEVVVAAPKASTAPTAGDPGTADAVTDADLVREGEAPQSETPKADDVAAAVVAGSDTPTVPLTGGAEGLDGPARSVGAGSVAILDEAPVLPSPQARLPSLPGSEATLSISTDPAQPPAPDVPGTAGAFDAPAISDAVTQSPAQPQLPDTPETGRETAAAVVAPDADLAETRGAEPSDLASDDAQPVPQDSPTAPEAPQDPVVAALPSALDPLPSDSDGPRIGRRANSLFERPEGVGPVAAPPAVRPIEAFAAPFENPDKKPLMAIILIDTGQDIAEDAVGVAALNSFPYPISFAVDASLPDAAERIAGFRAQGFEVVTLVDLPQGATASDVEVTLSSVLADRPEVVAVMEGVGTGVQASTETSTQITEALRATGHGLVLQSKGLNTAQKLALREGVPAGLIFRDFDSAGQSPSVIRRFLDQAAFRAGQEGGVIMVGRVRSDTISALLLWGLQDRAQRVALAPVSAVLKALAAGS